MGIKMETSTGVALIAGILGIVLLIGMMKKRAEWILNFALRGMSGMMMIYFINFALRDWAPTMEAGYNIITFLTTGLLGIPGVAMLYGIIFYMQL